MTHSRLLLAAALAAAAWLAPSRAAADPTFNPLFSDHMVLQRDMRVPVWGGAAPGEAVQVSFGHVNQNQWVTASAKADAAGAWRVSLPAQDAGGPFDLRVAGNKTVVLHDVLVGDVWICGGQSNMEFGLASATTGAEAAREADLPWLRLRTIQKVGAAMPMATLPPGGPGWVACDSTAAGGFSAVAFFFGRELLREQAVPIGLIESCWGGTNAETWTSRKTLEGDPQLAKLLAPLDAATAQWREASDAFPARKAEWDAAVKAAKQAGTAAAPPAKPADPRPVANNPSALFNGMIAPLLPYGIKGAIWYQGESNVSRAGTYRRLFPAMIQDWRNAWGEGDFPFLFVQIASYNYGGPQTQPAESRAAELREAQLLSLGVPRTAMAVTADIGNAADIHPRDKEDVGKRLALAAQAVAYGEKVVYSGPTYQAMQVEGSNVRLRFTHVGGGLAIGLPPGPPSNPAAASRTPEAHLRGFAIAGADHKFVWAEAEIDGQAVVVHSPRVPSPAAVRYGWSDSTDGNLYNKEGLPASSFRTDGGTGMRE